PSIFSQMQSRPPSIAAQAADALTAAPVVEGSVEDLPRICWAGKHYVLDSHVLGPCSRGRRSWVMGHGWFLAGITARGALIPGREVWCCRHCDQQRKHVTYDASSTSSASTHLAKEHRIRKH
ncbi:hypothetical protein B0T24DRAFT_495000, partial [Lasiosphaeria ovina]